MIWLNRDRTNRRRWEGHGNRKVDNLPPVTKPPEVKFVVSGRLKYFYESFQLLKKMNNYSLPPVVSLKKKIFKKGTTQIPKHTKVPAKSLLNQIIHAIYYYLLILFYKS